MTSKCVDFICIIVYIVQLWAYNTHEIIGRGRSPRRIISRVLYAHNCLQTGLCFVTQLDCLVARPPVYRHVVAYISAVHQRLPWRSPTHCGISHDCTKFNNEAIEI